jgi:hypothetical protein
MEGPVLSFLGMVNLPRRFRPPWDHQLLLNFDCAGGGRPTFFAGVGQVAKVRII